MVIASPYYRNDIRGIFYIEKLAPDRPIWKMTVNDGSQLVLKFEGSGNNSVVMNIKHAQNAMKWVSQGNTSKPLSEVEKMILRDYIAFQAKMASDSGLPVEKSVQLLQQLQNENGSWVKMLVIQGILGLDKAIEKMDAGDDTGVRKIVKTLNAPNGFEKLGQIVGIDLYNGNNDRFSPFGSTLPNTRKGAHRKTYQVLANVGNVVISIQDNAKTGEVIGLDAFDPGGANFSDGIFDPSTYSGSYLTSGNRKLRKNFADKIVEDLEDAWGPMNMRYFPLASTTRLKSNSAKRLVLGMEYAANAIKTKLENSVFFNKYDAKTQALQQERLKILKS